MIRCWCGQGYLLSVCIRLIWLLRASRGIIIWQRSWLMFIALVYLAYASLPATLDETTLTISSSEKKTPAPYLTSLASSTAALWA